MPLLSELTDSSPGRFLLSDAEWITLFPVGKPSRGRTRDTARGDAPLERGASQRVADALTLPRMLEALEPTPVLAVLLRLQVLLSPIAASHRPFWDLVIIPMWGLLWYFAPSSGLFSTASLVAATVAFGVQCLVWGWSVLGFGVFRRKSKTVEEPDKGGSVAEEEPTGGGFEAHGLATLARWMNLVDFADSLGRAQSPSVLIQHVAGDDLCPCKSELCAGSLPRSASISRPIYIFFQMASSILVWYLLRGWTLRITLGSTFWNVPWAAFMAVFARECLVGALRRAR